MDATTPIDALCEDVHNFDQHLNISRNIQENKIHYFHVSIPKIYSSSVQF